MRRYDRTATRWSRPLGWRHRWPIGRATTGGAGGEHGQTGGGLEGLEGGRGVVLDNVDCEAGRRAGMFWNGGDVRFGACCPGLRNAEDGDKRRSVE